jgi:putative transposase
MEHITLIPNTNSKVKCKFCGSPNVIRYGHYKGLQRWWCKDCHRKFASNNALPNMRTPHDQVASALSMFYEGMSLNAIRRHLNQMHNYYPSDSSVYEWITKFSKKAIENATEYKPKVGDVWVADETVLKIGGKNIWFWDIIDAKTRFLLASHLSVKRNISDAQMLMKKAQIRAGKIPQIILTDKLNAYLEGVERTFGGDTKHIASKGFRKPLNTNLIERFHSTLKQRTKVMRGLKDIESAKLIMRAWLVHYNFFRPHEGIDNFTPSQKAGIISKQRNWLDVVKNSYIMPKPKVVILDRPKRFPLSRKMPRISRPIPKISHAMPRLR